MEFVAFQFIFIIFLRTCMGDIREYGLESQGQKSELMNFKDTWEHTKYSEVLRTDLEALLQTWKEENKHDHEELEHLFEQRVSSVYATAFAIEVLFLINALVFTLARDSVTCQKLVKCLFPSKHISVKSDFYNQSSGGSGESQESGRKNSHKTEKKESEDLREAEICESQNLLKLESVEGAAEVTDQFDTNRVANNSETQEATKIILSGISSRDSINNKEECNDDTVKPRDTFTVMRESIHMGNLSGSVSGDACEKHKHSSNNIVEATPGEPNQSNVASDLKKHPEEDPWQSDNTNVKSTVPFRLEHTEVQDDSNNTDQLCENNETSNNTKNSTRDVSMNSISSSVIMENVTVFVGQDELRKEGDIVTPTGNLQNLCQHRLWNRGVNVKIVHGNNSYVGTIYRYTRLCPNGYNIDGDTSGQSYRGESHASGGQFVVSSLVKNRKQDNIQSTESMKLTSWPSQEADQQGTRVSNGTIAYREIDVQTSFPDNTQGTVLTNDIEEDGAEDVVDGLMNSRRNIMLHSHTGPSSFISASLSSNNTANETDNCVAENGITSDMQAVLRCIDLRVDDVPGPVTNAAGNEERNEDYHWPYLNENFEDIPQVESSNRRIYAELRRIDDVLGYFSNGDSIDVFVNLKETDADDILSRICQITGEGPEKFHIKDSEEQWQD